MRKFDELRLPQSCLNRAESQEPLFVLLGRDITAPFVIEAWINERIASGKNTATDPQIMEARMAAQDCRRFAASYSERIQAKYLDKKE